LLRTRRERPRGCRAAEQCEEVAPPHGAYPKAKDRGLTIAGLGWVGGVRRNKKRSPISGSGLGCVKTVLLVVRAEDKCEQDAARA
jgi:hypothetical protein